MIQYQLANPDGGGGGGGGGEGGVTIVSFFKPTLILRNGMRKEIRNEIVTFRKALHCTVSLEVQGYLYVLQSCSVCFLEVRIHIQLQLMRVTILEHSKQPLSEAFIMLRSSTINAVFTILTNKDRNVVNKSLD